MNHKALFKLCLVIICIASIYAQEEPAPSESVPAANNIATEVSQQTQSIQANKQEVKSSSQGLQQETENTATIQPQTNQTQEKVTQDSQLAPAQNTLKSQQQPPLEQATQSVPQPAAQPQTLTQTDPPTPQAPTQEQNPTHNPQNLQNLTQQQKQLLLHEQSIRAQLHLNSDLKLANLANLTVEMQMELERRFAQESRLAYQRAQKDMEEREAKEKEEIQRLLREAKLSRSQQIKLRERNKLTEVSKAWKSKFSTFGNEVMFDIEPETEEDFIVSLPVAQSIGIIVSLYSNKDGVYVKASNVDDEQPLTLRIFENNHRLLYQQAFFFNDGYAFEGNADCSYTFRFGNSNKHRLISMRLTPVLQRAQIQQKLTANDVASHSYRTNELYMSTQNKFTGLSQKATLQTSNRRRLTEEIKRYYTYNIIQIVVFIVLVLVQIEMIRKLLGSASIV